MLILICGLPRAGKTTLASKYEPKYNVIHLDSCGFLGNPYRDVKKKLSETEGDVIVEGVYYKLRDRQELLDTYQGDIKKCVWLDTPKEMKKGRHGYSSRCEFHFDIPTKDEGWDEIYHVTNGEFDLECIL